MKNKNNPDWESFWDKPMPTDDLVSDKQRDILRAAEKLFTEQGFDAPTAQIAKEAKVTERTLFKYFPTKSHLMNRILYPLLMRTILPAQIQTMQRLLNADYPTYEEFFRAIAKERWLTVRELGPRLKLVLSTLLANDSLRHKVSDGWKDSLWPEVVAGIRRYQEKGQLRNDVDAETLARLQIVVIAGHALLHGVLARDLAFDPDRSTQTLAKILFEGLGAKKP
jgi:TetR/AcrR family transcriptional regulator